jgi:Asp-tRNA(Asn)/Glu-tRNA(Gln) amidotransferase A subunit family amidase
MERKYRRCFAARMGFALLLLVSVLSGCATPFNHDAGVTRNDAFIDYWPPDKGTTDLRLAVKDLIDLKGLVTRAGSRYFEKNGLPAKRDAACMAIARERGVQVVGKTNLDEFAVGVTGMNEYFGIPRNRLSRRRNLIPGGSSSGTAVAVQSGMADVAFGTDTAGSIRVPAACCGIVGLKTTHGLVSLRGIYPLEPAHMDTVGPMGKDIAHVVEGMDLLKRGFQNEYEAAAASGRDFRIGRLYVDGTDPKIDQAIDAALTRAHFTVVRLGKDFKVSWEQAQKDATTVAEAGAWISDGKLLSKPDVGGKVKAAIALGQVEYTTNYKNALSRQAAWRRALRKAFARVDFIALPTLQKLPPRIPLVGGTPVFEVLVFGLQNTQAVNFAGNPALAMPVPVEDKDIPVTSLQLIGPRLSEARLLSAGRAVELAVRSAEEKAMAAKSDDVRDDTRLKWRARIRAAMGRD